MDENFSYQVDITKSEENPIKLEKNGYNFVKIKTINDNDNFYHALLNCIYSEYQNLNDVLKKVELVQEFKKKVIINFIKEDSSFTDEEVFLQIKKNLIPENIYIESENNKILEATINKKPIFSKEEKKILKNNSKFFTLNKFKAIFILINNNKNFFYLLDKIKNRNILEDGKYVVSVFLKELNYLICDLLNINYLFLSMWNNNISIFEGDIYSSYKNINLNKPNFIIIFINLSYYDYDLKERNLSYESGGIINNNYIQTLLPINYLYSISNLPSSEVLIQNYFKNSNKIKIKYKIDNVNKNYDINNLIDKKNKQKEIDYFEEDIDYSDTNLYLNTEPILSDINQIDFSFSKQRSETLKNSYSSELPYWLKELDDDLLEEEFKEEDIKINDSNREEYKLKLLNKLG